MRTLQITRRVDDDGVLRLEIPAEGAGDEVEVVVVIEPRHTTARPAWREALRQTWGSCPDLKEPADPSGLLPGVDLDDSAALLALMDAADDPARNFWSAIS